MKKLFNEENQITLYKKVPNPTGSGPTTLKKMKCISSEPSLKRDSASEFYLYVGLDGRILAKMLKSMNYLKYNFHGRSKMFLRKRTFISSFTVHL
jgi:hypothetical protein